MVITASRGLSPIGSGLMEEIFFVDDVALN